MKVSHGCPAAVAATMRKWNQSSRPFARRPFQTATMGLGSRRATYVMASRAHLSSIVLVIVVALLAGFTTSLNGHQPAPSRHALKP
jgi:hypothetical protein